MWIRCRVAGLMVGLTLLGAGREMAGQNLPPPTREDSLKGQIWTAAARRLWADTRQKQPQPKPWATGTDFTRWALAQQDDKPELNSLRGAVIKRIGQGQTGTAGQVAEAILDEIAQRHSTRTGTLARIDAVTLATDLAKLTQPDTVLARAAPPDSAAAPAAAS
ncbi:MAG: hypothetical protein H7Z21_04095, partial [Hymenobacter sp.]|nr:hypothetical protein [Hymenobacter sp.]